MFLRQFTICHIQMLMSVVITMEDVHTSVSIQQAAIDVSVLMDKQAAIKVSISYYICSVCRSQSYSLHSLIIITIILAIFRTDLFKR